MENIVQFTIKMENIFKCGIQMFHLNLIMPWYKIWASGNINIRFKNSYHAIYY